jgi:16S rRNA (guanine527-N7)-methyltransferase
MFRELLISEWKPYGTLSAEQLAALEHHYEQLTIWNQKTNLTRIRDVAAVVRLHYCESMFLGSVLPAGQLAVVDVGSGAGFPGVPLAIVRPDCRITLVESNRRKAVFLRESCRGILNISVSPGRAEDLNSRYDWVVSRAVRPIDVLRVRVAPSFAILTSVDDLAGLPPASNVISLPWGDRRVIAMFQMFHMEHPAC